MRGNVLAHKAGLVVCLLFLPVQARSAQQKISRSEQLLFDSVNRERAARRLPLLKWDESLALAARKHAELMAEESQLMHQLPGEPNLETRAREAGARFSHITENIGKGEDDGAFHDGWMHSPGHRANILDAQVDSVGIAVVEGGELLFAVEDFAQAVPILSIEEQEKRVGALLAARGLRLLKIGKEVRESCKPGGDLVGSGKPRYITHYETPDISSLPESLEKEIKARPYKSAAVGACPPTSGLARFRIVVLLY